MTNAQRDITHTKMKEFSESYGREITEDDLSLKNLSSFKIDSKTILARFEEKKRAFEEYIAEHGENSAKEYDTLQRKLRYSVDLTSYSKKSPISISGG